jgi:hypothetical protein
LLYILTQGPHILVSLEFRELIAKLLQHYAHGGIRLLLVDLAKVQVVAYEVSNLCLN